MQSVCISHEDGIQTNMREGCAGQAAKKDGAFPGACRNLQWRKLEGPNLQCLSAAICNAGQNQLPKTDRTLILNRIVPRSVR